MNVIIDWNCFQKGGIYRYFTEIIPRLAATQGIEVSTLDNASKVVAPPSHDDIQHLRRITPSAGWFPDGKLKRQLSVIRKGIDHWAWQRQLSRKKDALLHATGYSPSPIPRVPLITTIYDLIPELFPEQSAGCVFDDLRRDKKRTVKAAQRIVTISRRTKVDTCDYYNYPEDRIDVTPLGVDYAFYAECLQRKDEVDIREKYNLPEEPFFLYVGGRLQYKNFQKMIEAYRASRAHKDIAFVVAGADWNSDERALLKQLGLLDRVVGANYPSQTELRGLYQLAHAFVYPSLYEGFGLPVLESMSCGTPVLASTGGSIPEVGDDAAIYFNPQDVDEMAQIFDGATDSSLLEPLREKGRVRAQSFSWDRTTELTVKAYQKALT